jgi:hypothetical protein
MMINLAVSIWRGEKDLASTIWIFGVIGTIVIYALFFIVMVSLNYLLPARMIDPMITFIFIIIQIILVAYPIFIAVSIWRSADKHARKGAWALLAKAAAIVIVGYALSNRPTANFASCGTGPNSHFVL